MWYRKPIFLTQSLGIVIKMRERQLQASTEKLVLFGLISLYLMIKAMLEVDT